MDTVVKGRESAALKARRYLTEGRLTVRHVSGQAVRAVCRGDGAEYVLGLTQVTRQWWCSCPARTDQCAHLRALRLVVDQPT